jgi:hypothetical protein
MSDGARVGCFSFRDGCTAVTRHILGFISEGFEPQIRDEAFQP